MDTQRKESEKLSWKLTLQASEWSIAKTGEDEGALKTEGTARAW